MAYSSFTLSDLRHKFGLHEKRATLFEGVTILEPSENLKSNLALYSGMPMLSEKAKSEWIIAPILADVWQQCGKSFNIFSGMDLDADAENGLNGECDFILSAEAETRYSLVSPIFTIMEAKKDDFVKGVAQCAAQMLGARLYNQKDGIVIEEIYGCVTNGEEWQFMLLKDNILHIDTRTYFTNELPTIMGILKNIVEVSTVAEA